MKKLIFYLLLPMLACIIAVSCSSDLDPEAAGNHRYPYKKPAQKVYKVNLSFGGDYIDEDEEPLNRAEDSVDPEVDGVSYVGFNVWSTEDIENAEEKLYAYGVFDHKDNLLIDLITGSTYRFDAAIITERRDKVELVGNSPNQGYAAPFNLANISDIKSTSFDNATNFPKDSLNDFRYTAFIEEDAQVFLCNLKSGSTWVNVAGDNDNPLNTCFTMVYPRIKRYDSGTVDKIDPRINTDVVIPMTNKSFGIRFVIKSIPEGTYVTVEDQNVKYDNTFATPFIKNPEEILLFPSYLKLGKATDKNEKEAWEGIFSLNDFEYNSKNFILKFTWHKGTLPTDVETFTYPIEVNAGKIKVLNLNIDGTPDSLKTGNINFTYDSEELIVDDSPETISNNSNDENQNEENQEEDEPQDESQND